jgi:hypothetical protein
MQPGVGQRHRAGHPTCPITAVWSVKGASSANNGSGGRPGERVAAPVALLGEAGYEGCTTWHVSANVRLAPVVVATAARDVVETVRFAAAGNGR